MIIKKKCYATSNNELNVSQYDPIITRLARGLLLQPSAKLIGNAIGYKVSSLILAIQRLSGGQMMRFELIICIS